MATPIDGSTEVTESHDLDVEALQALISEPVVTPEEPTLAALSPEEKKMALKVMPLVERAIRKSTELKLTKANDILVEELKASNAKFIKEYTEEMRKKMAPITEDDIKKLVTQEYLEYTVVVRTSRTTREEKTFIIQELTQKTEKKFFAMLQKTFVPNIKEISGMDFTSSADLASKIQGVVDKIPALIDTLSEMTQICLDPFGEDEEITVEWVQKNLSSYRQAGILAAQASANRYRDFISLISQGMSSL